jgi:hypothetical protein
MGGTEFDTSSEVSPVAKEKELRQLRTATRARDPKHADLVGAALQDMVMVKTICTKIQNKLPFKA